MPQALEQKKFGHQCFVGNKSLVFTLHVFWSKNFWPIDILIDWHFTHRHLAISMMILAFARRHDNLHNDIQHNDIQHNGLFCDTQHT
jgi:hypothetical protein